MPFSWEGDAVGLRSVQPKLDLIRRAQDQRHGLGMHGRDLGVGAGSDEGVEILRGLPLLDLAH